MKRTGIYKITNALNGNKYIGSAVNISVRWSCHRSSLRKGKHHSIYLQNAWNKYGEAQFKFEILLECEINELVEFEQIYLDEENPEYNICKVAGSCLGRNHSIETILKMSLAKKNKPLTEEHKAALRLPKDNTNRPAITDETRTKLREAALLRQPHTEESKEKIRSARKNQVFSKESIAKRSDSNRNKKRSAEFVERISELNTGKKRSNETRLNQSKAHKDRGNQSPLFDDLGHLLGSDSLVNIDLGEPFSKG